jgi:hypothetical protein
MNIIIETLLTAFLIGWAVNGLIRLVFGLLQIVCGLIGTVAVIIFTPFYAIWGMFKG